MNSITNFPYFEVQFNSKGLLLNKKEALANLENLDASIDDLFVISHGWNNNIQEAHELYVELFNNVNELLKQGSYKLDGRRVGILGIIWPSKKFTNAELIPGGAAASGGNDAAQVLTKNIQSLDDLMPASVTAEAIKLIPHLADASVASQFADLIRKLISEEDAEHPGDLPTGIFTLESRELIERLSAPSGPIDESSSDGAADFGFGNFDAVAFASSLIRGPKDAAQDLLNLFTYYKMKRRAGEIGFGGAHELLSQIRDRHPNMKFHFIGHSFGARLVTALAAGSNKLQISTMTLLQAAFSHYGFAKKYDGVNDGTFRHVITEKRIHNAILITHTKNDKAVSLAYPIASRIARQAGSNLTRGKHALYGGMGSLGANKTEATKYEKLLGLQQSYAWSHTSAGKGNLIYNLLADDYIKSHGGVRGYEVAHAILSAAQIT